MPPTPATSMARAAAKKIDISAYTAKSVIGDDKVEKIGLFGDPATGKTSFLVGPLVVDDNCKVLVVSTDLGTDGTEALVDWAHMNDRMDIVQPERLLNITIGSYKPFYAFLNGEAEKFLPPNWIPDLIMHDGMTSMNVDAIDEEMLVEHESKEMKDNDLREDGLAAGQQDWGGIKRLTLRTMRQFMSLQIGGKMPHKVVTYLRAEGKVDDSKAALRAVQTRDGPLLQGTGRAFANVPVDLFIKTSRVVEDKKVEYYYDIAGDSSKTAVKRRGHSNLPDRMKADPIALWKMIRRVAPKE